jgi:hypothetical protein
MRPIEPLTLLLSQEYRQNIEHLSIGEELCLPASPLLLLIRAPER